MNTKVALGVVVLAIVGVWFAVSRRPLDWSFVRGSQSPAVSQRGDQAGPSQQHQGSAPAPGVADQGSMTPEMVVQALLRPKPFSEADLLARLNDPNRSLRDRREAARALAGMGSPAALAALREALQSGPSQVRAAIAEGLGHSPLPEARELLTALVNDPDEVVARGAVQGWGNVGDGQAAGVLSELLASSERPGGVRAEAALALGELTGQPEAYGALTNAAWQLRDDALAPAVLEGLGHREIGETHGFFREYLAAADLPAALRSAALEALGQAEGDSTALLLEFIGDPDPEVRASAAWALSATAETGRAGQQLIAQLQAETDLTVRLRLYQALGNQEQFDPASVIPLVQRETRPDVRLSGLDLLGQACRNTESASLRQYFDNVAVPELQTLALSGDEEHNLLSAVIALRRAETPAAIAALEQVALQSPYPRVAGAARGALSPLVP